MGRGRAAHHLHTQSQHLTRSTQRSLMGWERGRKAAVVSSLFPNKNSLSAPGRELPAPGGGRWGRRGNTCTVCSVRISRIKHPSGSRGERRPSGCSSADTLLEDVRSLGDHDRCRGAPWEISHQILRVRKDSSL